MLLQGNGNNWAFVEVKSQQFSCIVRIVLWFSSFWVLRESQSRVSRFDCCSSSTVLVLFVFFSADYALDAGCAIVCHLNSVRLYHAVNVIGKAQSTCLCDRPPSRWTELECEGRPPHKYDLIEFPQ